MTKPLPEDDECVDKRTDSSADVTEPQLLRVKEPEPLRLLLVNLGYLGKWSFPGLNQLL